MFSSTHAGARIGFPQRRNRGGPGGPGPAFGYPETPVPANEQEASQSFKSLLSTRGTEEDLVMGAIEAVGRPVPVGACPAAYKSPPPDALQDPMGHAAALQLVAFVYRHPHLVTEADERTGRTLLHHVCASSELMMDVGAGLEMVQGLVKRGADPCVPDKWGRTPIMCALNNMARQSNALAPFDAPLGDRAGGAAGAMRGDGPPRPAVAQVIRSFMMQGHACPTSPANPTEGSSQGFTADPQTAFQYAMECVDEFNRFKMDIWGYAEEGDVRAATTLIQVRRSIAAASRLVV